jgi:hypothetical protein
VEEESCFSAPNCKTVNGTMYQYHAPEGQDTDDPKQRANDRVDKVELGKWISPTEIQIMKRVLADNPPSNPQWFDYTLVLRFENGKAWNTR